MSHDSEATIEVTKCKLVGCYARAINYTGGATIRQLAALADISINCRQSIRVSNNCCYNVEQIIEYNLYCIAVRLCKLTV